MLQEVLSGRGLSEETEREREREGTRNMTAVSSNAILMAPNGIGNQSQSCANPCFVSENALCVVLQKSASHSSRTQLTNLRAFRDFPSGWD